jgi:transcriptional regulator with XRE-family HTH domain
MHTGTAVQGRQPSSVVGQLLRDWRATRGMSQLDLAMQAGFSARHVSFIETGRTQPSRQALLVLAETLEIPLRERNRLLEAGGYAHVYSQTPLAAEEMGHIRGVLQFILDRHNPYAAVVLDRYANCVMGNGASARLLEAVVDPSLITAGANLLRMVFHPLGARRGIANWDEVSRHLLARAERELGSAKDDQTAAALLTELRGYAGEIPGQRLAALSAGDLLLPIHIRTSALELRLFSTIMTLGTPKDVTLQEMRIETFFPADEASEKAWRGGRWRLSTRQRAVLPSGPIEQAQTLRTRQVLNPKLRHGR